MLHISETFNYLGLNPDLASVTPGSCNLNSPRPNVPIYINTHQQIDAIVKTMKDRKIRPNIGIFDVSMIYNAHKLLLRELIEPPFRFIFVLGGYMAMPVSREEPFILIIYYFFFSIFKINIISIGS